MKLIVLMGKWLFALGAIAGLTAGGVYWYQNYGPAARVEAELAAESLEATQELVCPGYVDTLNGVTPLAALQPSRVAEIRVTENQAVEAGEVLMRFDDALARQSLAEAEALLEAARLKREHAQRTIERHALQVEQQQAAVEALQAGVEAARQRRSLEQARREFKQGSEAEVAIADQQIRQAEAALKADQAKLAELELLDPRDDLPLLDAEVKHAEVKLRQAQVVLDQCELRAPQAGLVLRVLAAPGEVIGPMRPAIELAGGAKRIVRVEIEQAYADQVAEGATAVVEDEGQSERQWRARVLRLSHWFSRPRTVVDEAAAYADVRTLECIVEIDEAAPDLRIGQRVWVHIRRPESGQSQADRVARASSN